MSENPQDSGSVVESLVPIDSPLVFSGINGDTLRDFSSIFQQMGVHAVQGAGGVLTNGSKPAAGWEHALNPGEASRRSWWMAIWGSPASAR